MLSPGKDALGHTTYKRHRPEKTLLYQLIEKHYPALIEQLDAQGKSLPLHVHQEFDAYRKCGRLEHGFLRVRCDNCQFERLVAFFKSMARAAGSSLGSKLFRGILGSLLK